MVQKLAEKINTQVHFLHVMSVPDTVSLDNNGQIQTCGEIDPGYIFAQKTIIDRKLNNLKLLYGTEINTHLVLGKITDNIIEFAEKNEFDLIVMGTKGRKGIEEKLSSSETQLIARKSKVPLLSLMCDRSDLQIKNILLVHDFGKQEHEDLRLLKKIVQAFNAKVFQLHILSNKHTEQEKEKLFENMNEHAAQNQITNFENHFMVDNDIENGVIHFNQMHEADLLCIGTHGKGGFFHSSAAEKLINHMYKPIISFQIKK
jgi:nucleotide-binding universal stress UspA family protein